MEEKFRPVSFNSPGSAGLRFLLGVWELHWMLFLPWSASLVAQSLKRLPPMRETWVRSLGGEDLLEKEMATQLCLTFCDLMDCSTPGFPVYH